MLLALDIWPFCFSLFDSVLLLLDVHFEHHLITRIAFELYCSFGLLRTFVIIGFLRQLDSLCSYDDGAKGVSN